MQVQSYREGCGCAHMIIIIITINERHAQVILWCKAKKCWFARESDKSTHIQHTHIQRSKKRYDTYLTRAAVAI